MVLPLKVLAGCGGFAGVSLVGCYFGGVFNDTPWLSLQEWPGDDSGSSGSVGKGRSIYLLAVHGDKNSNRDFNRSKWEELYKKWSNDKDLTGDSALVTEFGKGKVSGAYGVYGSSATEDPKPLNEVCKAFYAKQDSEFEFTNKSDNKYKLARDLLKYCSPLGKKPVTVKEHNDSYASGKIGGTDGNKNVLASTKDPANYYFWQAQEKWFEGETGAQNNGFFGTAFKNGSNNKKVLKTSLKDKCEEAYGLEGSTNENSTSQKPKIDDVKKYCSFQKLSN